MQRSPVLYAEDNDDDIFFMQLAFERAEISHPLIIVKDGLEALQYLAGTTPFARSAHPYPALLLLDLNLPIKSGFEVLQWLREQPGKALNVVVVSSSSQQLDIDLAKKIGIQDYLIKPASPARLVELVRQVKQRWLE